MQYAQFANSVQVALVQHQIDIRQALKAVSQDVTRFAQYTNVTWPFFTLPRVELAAKDLLVQAKSETFVVLNRVMHEDRTAWESYATANYNKWVEEGHMFHYGNLDNLKPVGFHPYISQMQQNQTFAPEQDLDSYFPFWCVHPPPRSFAAINRNVNYIGIDKALVQLKNETVVSGALAYPYQIVYTEEQHKKFHSELPGNPINNFPHSFWGRAILERLDDPESDVVGIIITAIGWDRALLDLLPHGVEGIHVVLESTCGQVYTFELIGPGAVYMGEGDLHDPVFDGMMIATELSFHSHPAFEEIPGHCVYRTVRRL